MIRIAFIFSILLSISLAYDPYSTSMTARRERNLDHLDVETLSYYLGINSKTKKSIEGAEYVGYDVAVMFYAQWDRMSHTLAPYWDNIGTKLNAGSKQSKLIMGLFDCELNLEHAELCTAAGVMLYPTLLFIGSGPFHDTDPITRIVGKDRAAGPSGAATIPRTVKFQGNWQYTDSVKDWIRTMQGLSRWHRWTSEGFLWNLRKGLLGLLQTGGGRKSDISASSLPVGIPVSSGSNAQTSVLESTLETVTEAGELMERAATHASLLLENILFPPEKDAFKAMTDADAWDKKNNSDPEIQVLRSCVTDLCLDYCSRLSTRMTNEYLDEILSGEIDSDYDLKAIETDLKNRLSEKEVYCGIFDDCLAEDFVSEKCRPDKCPLSQNGCTYVTACFDNSIKKRVCSSVETNRKRR
mmetsp:Transcript_7257/g.11448  ORF Transcript_7257/g.11448 Transcript_7257/m.11448 type:complete len:411 (+) Transcript_7257:71-1303(+)